MVLLAQQLGLNTCWVGSTFKKKPECYNLAPGEKVVAAIAIGYGANQGKSRKSKSMCDVSDGTEVSLSVPEWYKNGVLAAMMAPTAMNRQSFYFERFETWFPWKRERVLSPRWTWHREMPFEIGAGKG